MLLVTRAQNFISHITPQFLKALSPLTKRVIGLGVVLAGATAVYIYSMKPAPSLKDRVKDPKKPEPAPKKPEPTPQAVLPEGAITRQLKYDSLAAKLFQDKRYTNYGTQEASTQISAQFITDYESFDFIIDGRSWIKQTCMNFLKEIFYVIKLPRGPLPLLISGSTQMMVKKHFEECHAKMAADYFAQKNSKYEAVGKHIVEIKFLKDQPKEKFQAELHLRFVQLYRAKTETSNSEMKDPTPAVIVVSKTMIIQRDSFFDFSVSNFKCTENLMPFANLQDALASKELLPIQQAYKGL